MPRAVACSFRIRPLSRYGEGGAGRLRWGIFVGLACRPWRTRQGDVVGGRSGAMVAMLFALICALAYGTADFLGGLGARPVHVLRVLAVAAPAALAVQVACWPWLGAVWTTEAIVCGAASGIASVAASAL